MRGNRESRSSSTKSVAFKISGSLFMKEAICPGYQVEAAGRIGTLMVVRKRDLFSAISEISAGQEGKASNGINFAQMHSSS